MLLCTLVSLYNKTDYWYMYGVHIYAFLQVTEQYTKHIRKRLFFSNNSIHKLMLYHYNFTSYPVRGIHMHCNMNNLPSELEPSELELELEELDIPKLQKVGLLSRPQTLHNWLSWSLHIQTVHVHKQLKYCYEHDKVIWSYSEL